MLNDAMVSIHHLLFIIKATLVLPCQSLIVSSGHSLLSALLSPSTRSRNCACNMSFLSGRLRSGCRVPWQSFCMRREPLPIALTDQAPSVAVPSAVCLSTSTARYALGYSRPARLTNRAPPDLHFWTVLRTVLTHPPR